MRKALLCVVMFLPAAVAGAATVNVRCGGPGPHGSIGNTLKWLSPAGPNTLNVFGTCRENVVIRSFDRLSLVAKEGASIEDASGGQQTVLDIVDSRRIDVRGFRITGGLTGAGCHEASLCRFAGNTIEGSGNEGVSLSESQATFQGDTIQDAGGSALALQASTATAWSLTVQRSGWGIWDASGSVMRAFGLLARDNRSDGVYVIEHSHLDLFDSTLSGNGGSGLSLFAHSHANVWQDSATGNALFGIAIGDLSSVDLFGGGTFTGNSAQDIRCWGQLTVASHLENATFGTNDCPMP